MPTVRGKNSNGEAKEQIPVYPLDVYAVTAKGEAELKSGSTLLSPEELQTLVLIDGNLTVGQITRQVRGISAEEMVGVVRRLIRDGLVSAAADEAGLDFGNFFDDDTPVPEPTPEAARRAVGEAKLGTGELQTYGYYVSIARRAAQPRTPTPGSVLSVLIVEDDRHLSKLLTQLLRIEGFQTRTATNKGEIIAALRQLPSPDLVLLDVMLPDVNGFDILQRIKQHPALKSIAVIMVTGQATRDNVMRGLASGADGYVTKPFDVDTLINGVRSVLGLTRSD